MTSYILIEDVLIGAFSSLQIYRTEITHLLPTLSELDGIKVAAIYSDPKASINELYTSTQDDDGTATFGEQTPDQARRRSRSPPNINSQGMARAESLSPSQVSAAPANAIQATGERAVR